MAWSLVASLDFRVAMDVVEGARMDAAMLTTGPRFLAWRSKGGRAVLGARGVMSKVTLPMAVGPFVQPRVCRVLVMGGRCKWWERRGRRTWDVYS